MNRLKLLAAALPLLAASFALAGDLEDGKALQQAGKYEEALPKFEAAAKADPTDADAALGYSQVLSGLGRYEAAAKAVDAARKAHPENAALIVAKARAYLLASEKASQGEDANQEQADSYRADADRWSIEALKGRPATVEALVLRGQIHQRKGDLDQAKSFFEDAVKADPKSFDAQFELATYWWVRAGGDKKNMELWNRAETEFAKALVLDPKSARTAANLASCKAWQQAPGKDVAAAYFRAFELAPGDAALLSNAYKWTPAADRVAVFEKLAKESPKDVTLRLYVAAAYAGEKKYDKAKDVLGEASRLDPKSPYVPLNEGDVTLAEGKNVDEAIDFYVEAMTLFKTKGKIDDAVYIRLAGPVAFQDKRLSEEQREKIWAGLTKLFPDRSDAANNAGLWFRDIGKKYDKALEWYLKGVKISPEDCCLENDTGLIYHYHMNDFDKAEPYYRKAVEIGNAKGYDCNSANDPDRGFRDALTNMYKILSAKKRWADLEKFAENDVPEAHPMREIWLKQAQEKK